MTTPAGRGKWSRRHKPFTCENPACGRTFESGAAHPRWCSDCRNKPKIGSRLRGKGRVIRAAHATRGRGLKACLLCGDPFHPASALFCPTHRAEEKARTDAWKETGVYPTENSPW